MMIGKNTNMKEDFKHEQLINCKFIDFDGTEYELDETEKFEHFKNSYAMFAIMARPLIKIINESDECYVLFDHSEKRNGIFKIMNITEDVRNKADEFNIHL